MQNIPPQPRSFANGMWHTFFADRKPAGKLMAGSLLVGFITRSAMIPLLGIMAGLVMANRGAIGSALMGAGSTLKQGVPTTWSRPAPAQHAPPPAYAYAPPAAQPAPAPPPPPAAQPAPQQTATSAPRPQTRPARTPASTLSAAWTAQVAPDSEIALLRASILEKREAFAKAKPGVDNLAAKLTELKQQLLGARLRFLTQDGKDRIATLKAQIEIAEDAHEPAAAALSKLGKSIRTEEADLEKAYQIHQLNLAVDGAAASHQTARSVYTVVADEPHDVESHDPESDELAADELHAHEPNADVLDSTRIPTVELVLQPVHPAHDGAEPHDHVDDAQA